MEFSASNIAILIVFLGVIIGLIWDWSADWDDTFDDFWEKIERDEPDYDEEVDEPKRNKSSKK